MSHMNWSQILLKNARASLSNETNTVEIFANLPTAFVMLETSSYLIDDKCLWVNEAPSKNVERCLNAKEKNWKIDIQSKQKLLQKYYFEN